MKVRFRPSVDDYLYVASKINRADYDRSFHRYLYIAFLSINTIGFPAFLIYTDHEWLGLIVFGINLSLYLFGIAGVNEKMLTKFYHRAMDGSDDAMVVVEVLPDRLVRECDGDTTMLAWKNISDIKETESSIYFMFRGGAVAVRRSGFADDSEKEIFVALAEKYRKAAR